VFLIGRLVKVLYLSGRKKRAREKFEFNWSEIKNFFFSYDVRLFIALIITTNRILIIWLGELNSLISSTRKKQSTVEFIFISDARCFLLTSSWFYYIIFEVGIYIIYILVVFLKIFSFYFILWGLTIFVFILLSLSTCSFSRPGHLFHSIGERKNKYIFFYDGHTQLKWKFFIGMIYFILLLFF
jgi:hypothetical protein